MSQQRKRTSLVSFSLTERECLIMSQAAEEQNISVAEFVRRAVKEKLDESRRFCAAELPPPNPSA